MLRHAHDSFSFFTSLRGRLLFLICLATFPAFLFSFFLADQERTAAVSRIERDALHLARLASREHAHQIRGARDLLLWLGNKLAKEGKESLIIKDPDFLSTLLAGHPQLANVGVLSPDGQVLSSAYPISNQRLWGDNPAFVAALTSKDIAVGTYLISPIFERPTLNHAFAIRDSKQKVWAVLFNGLNLEWLSEMARQASLPEEFSLLIVDREGRVLAHSGPAHSQGAKWDGLQIPGISEISKSQKGRMLKIHGVNLHRYFVARPLEEATGLYVAVSLPFESVQQQAGTAFYRALVSLGILTLFTITVVFLSAELAILRTLRSLAHTVQRFGAGDFSVRAASGKGHNELDSLTRAFNTMAASLVARHQEADEAQAQLRALATRLQLARETEAARISRELHDEIGQMLTSLKMDLARLQLHCPVEQQQSPCSIALKDSIISMNQQISVAIDFVRRISSELRPGVLDKLGLVAALEWQSREIESRTKLTIQLDAEDIEAFINETISVTLFRIAQEALTNVIRHAEANVVEIKLSMSSEGVVLSIRDDGRGIMMDSLENYKSLGIIGMRERAALIGGRLSIYKESISGTTVIVVVPLTPHTGGC